MVCLRNITAERAELKAIQDEERKADTTDRAAVAMATEKILHAKVDLLSQAKRWAVAENIRAYVNAVKRAALDPACAALQSWGASPNKVAESLDPTKTRLEALTKSTLE